MSEETVEETTENHSRKRQLAATIVCVAVGVVLTGAASKAIDSISQKIHDRIAPEPSTPEIED